MLTKTAQLIMLLALALYFALVLFFLRRKRLALRYSLLGLGGGAVMLVFVLFPRLLALLARGIGIYDHTNALFAILFFCIILVLVYLTSVVSELNEKTKTLTQTVALLEKRVRELEEREK